MNSTPEGHKTWRKLFLSCKYLYSDEMCNHAACEKRREEDKDSWICCAFCDERLRCNWLCKLPLFKRYIRGEKGK